MTFDLFGMEVHFIGQVHQFKVIGQSCT